MQFRWRLPVFVALVSAVFLAAIVRVYQPTLDEGTYIDGAARILGGALPYRDFVEPAGPGSFYWLALWFRVFGTSFETARMLLLLTGVALVTLTFTVARRSGGNGYLPSGFVLLMSIPMMVMNSPHYDTTVLVLGAVLALSYRRFGVAGVCLGLADVCLQGKGLYTVAALVGCLAFRKQFRNIGVLVAGWAIPLLMTACWMWRAGILGDAYRVMVVWPATHYGLANGSPYAFPLGEDVALWWHTFSSKGPFLAAALVILFGAPFALAASVPILAPVAAWWTGVMRRQGLLVWACAFALFASEFHRRDLEHLLNGSVLLVVLFFGAKANRAVRMAWATVAASLCLYACLELNWSLSAHDSVAGLRGKLRVHEGAEAMTFLGKHTRPGEVIFSYPYRPVFYFWAGLRNATRYTLLMYGYNSDDQFREAVRDVEKARVRYVLWDENFGPKIARTVFPYYRQPEGDRLIMERYLMAHYKRVESAGGITIMERSGD